MRRLSRSSRPLHLILDFDGTITARDSLHTIAATAASRRPQPPNPTWSDLVNAYLTDPSPAREQRSVNRVAESVILAGVTRDDLFAAGRLVPLRDGFKDFVSQLQTMPNTASIVVIVASLNWSRDVIRGALAASGLVVDDIISNDLVYDAAGVSTGGIDVTLWSGVDKVSRLRERVGDAQRIYVGNSCDDVVCFEWAGVGVCVGGDPKVAELSVSLGVKVCEGAARWDGGDGVVRGGWEDVTDVLQRVDETNDVQ